MNPFKFGTIVGEKFFTDRTKELEQVKQMLDSENHLVLISPRRFGKSSLIAKALNEMGRPAITIDLMKVTSVNDLAAQILKEVFRIYKMEKVKHFMSHFRIAPTISFNPITDGWDVSFMPTSSTTTVALEDAMALLEKVTTPNARLIVVLDEFQEINGIDKNLTKILRATMQRQEGLNYVFMGSQESMMEEIFEKKKSPFYHFGQRMNLKKIPYEDFRAYITERLPESTLTSKEELADDILGFTKTHPYYTQQLAAAVFNTLTYNQIENNIVRTAINQLIEEHDLDYERLWATMKRIDRLILIQLAKKINPLTDRKIPTSTAFSAIKRLIKQGYIIKTNTYELEDPFFEEWILKGI